MLISIFFINFEIITSICCNIYSKFKYYLQYIQIFFMGELQKKIGERLRAIRQIFLEGDKVSTRQFANALGEKKDSITNYEMGKAGIPNRVLTKLYERGFNPVFILTGEGSMFADNENGRLIEEKINSKKKKTTNIQNIREIDLSKLSLSELERKVLQYQVAAGDIQKIIELKKMQETS
ncbi:hypothetical protein D9V86_05180 [Bacteroidetes/Chlorobi group bacterium ChocPot_Mid]|nr:MAG: hypothetical protein D9V86_05180 [Bacteroidetes/Chlorobi group bacterium ChocPot_Mid]